MSKGNSAGSVRQERDTGTVKWFSIERGYGFIVPDRQIGEDVFVHITAVQRSKLRSLEKDQRVSFNVKDNKGRPNAVNIEIMAAGAVQPAAEDAQPATA